MPQGLPDGFQPITPDDGVKTGLPEGFQPITPDAPTTTIKPDAEQPSLLNRAWHAISEPITDAPSRFAKSIGDYIDTPVNRDDSYLSGVAARAKGFTAGALQGIGDLASGFTSPINLATTAATMGEAPLMRAGFGGLAKIANLTGKASGALTATHGAGEILSPDSTLAQRGQGLVELAGGGAAMFHTPSGSRPQEAPETASTKPVTGSKAPTATPTEAPSGSQIPLSSREGVTPGVVDKFAKYRKVPIGTKYSVSPGNMNRRKMADAIKLGFDYEGLSDDGRIIIKKTRESPVVNMPEPPHIEANAWADAANLPRTVMASMDMSAPLRQGLGLIHKKQFWTALPDMVKAFGSEEAYKNIQQGILEDPIFQKRVMANGNIKPSFAEEAGLKLTDLGNMSTREESMLSYMAEKIPGVRSSNRAYTAFLNKLRADTFKQMTSDYGSYSGIDAKNNMALSKQIAEFVNTASGRGNLGKAEPAAKVLSSVLFSPRLMASRLGMMAKGGAAVFSPETYMLSQPNIRREYLKSLMAIAAASGTFTGLAKLAGAEVEADPASSDFGKPKFGNTRIDPYGGFQQYIVAAQRLMPQLDLSSVGLGEIGGDMKSTTTGKEYNLGDSGFGRSNRMDVLTRFIRSKTNPIINFGWGLMAGKKELSGKPMDMTNLDPYQNSIAQRFLPMLTQDIYDLVNDETTPASAKAMAAFAASLGMGSQTYGNER
jgi:hypothetical protein